MPILDTYTRIDSDQTIAEIQRALVRHGAQSIALDYNDGDVTAIAFRIQTSFGYRAYLLPVNVAGVMRVMEQEYAAGKVGRRPTPVQVRRTAWRILKTWLDAQLALIASGMVDLDQVLLPYMQTADGVTVYERFVSQQMQLPAPSTARRSSDDRPRG